jgi:hypothetical protein
MVVPFVQEVKGRRIEVRGQTQDKMARLYLKNN